MRLRFQYGAIAAALCTVCLLPSCRQETGTMRPDAPVTLKLLTGPATGSFGPLGNALVEAFGRRSTTVRLVAQATNGSVPNVQALQDGAADLGLAQAGVAYMAYNGKLPDANKAFKELRGIAVLHASYVHLLVAPGIRVESAAGLKGKRIGLGPVGTNGAVTSVIARGFYPGNEPPFRNLPVDQTSDALKHGEIDAVFVTSGIPSEEIQTATAAGAKLLDIKGDAADRLRNDYPFLKADLIPANTYVGQTSAVRTLSVDIVLMARARLDEAVVRTVTSVLFEVLPRLSVEMPLLRSMSIERASATPIPLHSGAALYYREKELGR